MSTFFEEESLRLLKTINLYHKTADVPKKTSKRHSAVRQFPFKCGRGVSDITKKDGAEIAPSPTRVNDADDSRTPPPFSNCYREIGNQVREERLLNKRRLQVKIEITPSKQCSFNATSVRCQKLDQIELKGDARQTIDNLARSSNDRCQPNVEAIDSRAEEILDKSSPSSEAVSPHRSSITCNKNAASTAIRRVFAIRTFPVGSGKSQNASTQDAESQSIEKLDAGGVAAGLCSKENKDEARFQSRTTEDEEVRSSKPEAQFAAKERTAAVMFNDEKKTSRGESGMRLEEAGDVKGRKRKKEDNFEIVAIKRGKYDFLASNGSGTVVPVDDDDEVDARKKVIETLSAFRSIHDSLPQRGNLFQPNHQLALKLFKERNGGAGFNQRVIGSVPGVNVGDEFRLRVEMFIIGLHHQHQAGIDYVKHDGRDVAISVVSSGRYSNERRNTDVLLYSGSGASHEDQKLERGNLALKNSIEAQIPVRVIHGVTKYHPKRGKTYVYDGLYLVEKYRTTKSDGGCFVLMFRLRRIPGQPQISIGRKQRSSAPISLGDVSDGEKDQPIRTANTADGYAPAPFKCLTESIRPPSYIPSVPKDYRVPTLQMHASNEAVEANMGRLYSSSPRSKSTIPSRRRKDASRYVIR